LVVGGMLVLVVAQIATATIVIKFSVASVAKWLLSLLWAPDLDAVLRAGAYGKVVYAAWMVGLLAVAAGIIILLANS